MKEEVSATAKCLEAVSSLRASIAALDSFIESNAGGAEGPGTALAGASVLLSEFKAANRSAALAVDGARARVAAASASADARVRELANLEYERAAVARELRALGALATPCLDALDLLPAAALSAEVRGAAGTDAHALMLARLDGEHAARATAASALELSRARATALRARIRAKMAALDAVPAAFTKLEISAAALVAITAAP